MRKTLEKLYFGNIHPSQKTFDRDSDYGRALSILTDTRQQLEATLNTEQNALLDRLVEALSTMSLRSERDDFIAGMPLGAKLMLELITDEKDGCLSEISGGQPSDAT